MKLQHIIEGVITITFILMKKIFCESYFRDIKNVSPNILAKKIKFQKTETQFCR